MLSSYILTFLLMNSDLLNQKSAQVPSEHRPDRGLCGAAERGRLPHQAPGEDRRYIRALPIW